jgi:5-methylcytosine-specific restriction enzyme subunit McrC
VCRTVELEEYRPRLCRLSRNDVARLAASNLVDIRPTDEQDVYSLTSGSVVGTAVWSDLRLLIRPKVQLDNVFQMLSYAEIGLVKWRTQRFPYAHARDILEAMARLLDAEIRAALTHGLSRDYRRREETLPTLRGRIDTARQIASRPGRPYPLDCVYEEFTEDAPLFRVIKAACRRILRFPSLDRDVRVGLQHALRAMSGVSDVPIDTAAVPALRFTRLNEHWEPAGRLSQLILRRESVRDRVGSSSGLSFTVDMNDLFEDFMERAVSKRARMHGLEFVRQARRKLSASVGMRPDFVLQSGGRDCAVGDAKYKRLDVGEWRNHDLYQALAYAAALRLDRALLVYAESEQAHREIVHARDGDYTIEIVGVDLSGAWAHVLDRADAAAQRLVRHAELLLTRSVNVASAA